MRKLIYAIILFTALVTIALQQAVIQKQNAELAELEVLFEKIERRVSELDLVGADT